MGYFPVRYDSRVVIYDRRGFIRLATGLSPKTAANVCRRMNIKEGSKRAKRPKMDLKGM